MLGCSGFVVEKREQLCGLSCLGIPTLLMGPDALGRSRQEPGKVSVGRDARCG